MIKRYFPLVILVLALTGCVSVGVPNDASKWTIELTSSEASTSGPCRIYDEQNRLMLEGTLESGKMDGVWTSWGSQGDRLVVWAYNHGVRNGPVQMWYGPLAFPEARGRLKLEGTFRDGAFDGMVTRYYPSGVRACARLYDHGILKRSESWMFDGTPESPDAARTEAVTELKGDLDYMAILEDMIARSLAQAQRRAWSK